MEEEHVQEDFKKEDEEYDEEEMSTEELVEHNDLLLNALIELLIGKGIITEEEFDKKVDEVEEDMYEDEGEGDVEEEGE